MPLLATATAGPSRPGGFVSIAREWEGETGFLVCGGPSFASVDVELLRGRRVMVVNSSLYAVPFADVLFFADHERWEPEHRAAVKAFKGRVLSSTWGDCHCNYIEFLRRPQPSDIPPGLSSNPSEAWVRHTSARGAINILCHLGVSRIVALGLDGKVGEPTAKEPKGRTHHHEPHSRGMNPDIWELQYQELAAVSPALKVRGIELLNASPGSVIPFWPIVDLKDVIAA